MEELILNPWELWTQAIGWSLVGVAFVKLLILDRKTILDKTFSWKYWLADNGLDALLGIGLTLITVKLGEVAFQVLGIFGINISGMVESMPDGTDPVQISLVVAIAFQWWLYKHKIKKSESAS